MNAHKVALKNSGILPGSGVNLITHPFEEYPSEKDGVNILAVIRIMKDKGIEEYLEAARILHEKNPKPHCHFMRPDVSHSVYRYF